MNKAQVFNFFLGGVFALYPVLVYFGLKWWDPRYLAFMLLSVALIRSFFFGAKMRCLGYLGLSAALLSVTLTMATAAGIGLYLYPVLINCAFLIFFAYSYFSPPTVIEQFARIREPDIPDKAIPYMRRVTLVWCGFFLCNGVLSLFCLWISIELWVLYTGLISYVLMAILFAAEYLVRRRLMVAHAE